jgi:hypothetical protein
MMAAGAAATGAFARLVAEASEEPREKGNTYINTYREREETNR